MSTRGSRRQVLAGLLLVATGATGCGSAALRTPPTGIDELVIPTPSPRPGDYVETIDNPWVAWVRGSTVTFAGTTPGTVGASSTGTVRVTMSVAADTTTVAGIAATTVTTDADGVSTVDWFAQDRHGNVWWLGRDGVWAAGEAGAEAGLLIAAAPRVGDGYRLAFAPGVVEDLAEVTAVRGTDDGVSEGISDTVQIQVSSDLSAGVAEDRTYVKGVGLTRVVRSGVDGFTWDRPAA